MNLQNAGHALEVVFQLGAFIARAIRDGKPERVEKILPTTLRTTLARQLADAEAEERFARRGDETRPMTLDPDRNGAGHE